MNFHLLYAKETHGTITTTLLGNYELTKYSTQSPGGVSKKIVVAAVWWCVPPQNTEYDEMSAKLWL